MIGNAQLLVRLRWVAIGFQLTALAGCIALKLPIHHGFFFLGVGLQSLVNVVTHASLESKGWLPEWHIFGQLILDLFALICFVIAGGGLASPFSGLFLIQAILAALLLSGIRVWLMMGATTLGYVCLMLCSSLSVQDHHQWMQFHLQGMVINHLLTTAVIAFFVVKIIRNLQQRDQQIAARQSLVGAGATAAQLAHKMGSPLNSIALLAEDLSSSTLTNDRNRILFEVSRCKQYLTELFNRLHRLDTLTHPTCLTPPLASFLKHRLPDLTVQLSIKNDRVFQATSVELLIILLDVLAENAVEAGATLFAVDGIVSSQNVTWTIENNGPAFPASIQTLMTAGYSQKEGPPHTGIGLFLARLVIESLGATVSIPYADKAILQLIIPIEALWIQ